VATAVDSNAATYWSLKELPAGYRKVDQAVRMVHGNALPVTHVVFSDGLASVSLFIEQAAKRDRHKTAMKATHGVVGNASFYASIVDGYQLTVVGEVPEATVAKIANAVVFRK